MKDLFSLVLGMSGTASVVVLLVLLARLALRRAPKRFSYALWAVVLFRLLCPLSLESAFSLLPSAGIVPTAGYGGQQAQVVQIQTGLPDLDRPVNDFFLRHPYQGTPDLPEYAETIPSPVIPQTGDAPDWRTVPAAVWLAGITALLGWSVLSLLRLRRSLQEAVPLAGEAGVWTAGRAPSPFVLGLLRPRIYLPAGLPASERDYILLHERTHIRRLDHIFRALAWLAAVVHWFNPLVWLAFQLAGKDMEMSCDEAVLRKIGRDVRADYSSSLLRLSTGGNLPVGPLAFGDSGPKSRIKNVLNYKKPALWVIVAAAAVVAATSAVLATNRASTPPEEGSAPPAEVWLDYLSALDELPWDEARNIQLPEFPGKTFCWTPDAVRELIPGADSAEPMISGMPVENVFLCDLNGDGKREFCATVCFGSGMVDIHIEVYDYANGRKYCLWDRGEYDYTLSLVDGQLMASKSEYLGGPPGSGQPLASGRLILTEDGRLAIEGQEVDHSAALPIDPNYKLSSSDSVLVAGLGGAYVEWDRYSYVQPFLYFAQDPAFFCHRLAGRTVEGSAMWSDSKEPFPTVVEVNFSVNGGRVESGTVDGFSISFTVDTESGTVTQKDFKSWVEGETLELKNHEMVAAARTFAKLLQGAEFFYYDAYYTANPVQAPDLDLTSAVYTLSDLWTHVDITGLDCEYAHWYARQLNTSSNIPENALGYLDISQPRFLGLSKDYYYAIAVYSPQEDPDRIWIQLGPRVQGGAGEVHCVVDLATGRQSPIYGEPYAQLDPQELLSAARAMAQLITQASDFHAASAVPEEGPLPFDRPMKLWFGSGAGGWATILTLHPDGTFEGDYEDADMTILYVCQFHGRFKDINQIGDNSWSMTLEELVLDTKYPVGREWDEGGFHYISSEPYGFDGKDSKALKPGARFTFYTPQATGYAPGDELYGMTEDPDSPLYEFWSWWPAKHGWGPNGGILGCYALHNLTSGRGFFDLHAWGLL